MRKRIFQIVEKGSKKDKLSLGYDIFMIVAIVASIVPLTFISYETPVFDIMEDVTVTIFIIDYVLRWSTADFRMKKGKWSFLLYPFTAWAILDLLSILPGLELIGDSFKVFRIARLLKILRLFKFVRYSKSIQLVRRVIRKERPVLLTMLGLLAFYIFLTALVMFNAENSINPETGLRNFRTFFDALYWATVTLTTVGYGDVCPVTSIGRFVSMLSSLFGVAIIALPSGVITASYLDELRNKQEEKEKGEAAQN